MVRSFGARQTQVAPGGARFMGTLFWKTSNKHVPLRTHALLGRHAKCDICIDAPKVSGEHASLHWTNDAWELRDLGSRNGTFIEGRRLKPGDRVVLETGQSFSLSRQSAEFELVDASGPGAVAINLHTNTPLLSEEGLLALPDDQHPLVTVFVSSDGEWMIENADTLRPAIANEILDIDGNKYRLELPILENETLQSGIGPPRLDSIAIRFAVTPDEEHVETTVIIAGHAKRLRERTFHYLLVTLARAWLADEGAPNSMRGWVNRDELCRGLEMDAMILCTEIYRARKQFAALGIQGAAGLIHRRASPYELRIGVPNVEVVKL